MSSSWQTRPATANRIPARGASPWMRATAVAFGFNAPRFIAFLGPLVAGTLVSDFGGYGQAAISGEHHLKHQKFLVLFFKKERACLATRQRRVHQGLLG